MTSNSIHQGLHALCVVMLAACPGESSDAREEYAEHGDSVAEALTIEETVERVNESEKADTELAEDQRGAHEDVEWGDESSRKQQARDGAPAKDVVITEAGSMPSDHRFRAYEGETKQDFESRAEAQIAAIEAEVRSLSLRQLDRDQTDTLADARTQLREARDDLDDVVDGSTSVFDDGKLGVAVAINAARRKVDRVKSNAGDRD